MLIDRVNVRISLACSIKSFLGCFLRLLSVDGESVDSPCSPLLSEATLACVGVSVGVNR